MLYAKLDVPLILIYLAKYQREFHCPACHRDGEISRITSPFIKRRGAAMEVTFHVNCACGAPGSQLVRMPLWLFGLCVAEFALLEARGRRLVRKAYRLPPLDAAGNPITLPPGPGWDSQGRPIRTESHACDAGPSEQERNAFGFSPEDWGGFVKRLGYDKESQSPPTDEG